MLVASERIGETFTLHYDKRNTVRKRSFFVWSGFVKFQSGGKQSAVTRNDFHTRIAPHRVMKLHEHLAVVSLTARRPIL
jgi:hypothetical protein